ncbi:MAG: oxyanion-translocating ATPase [Candidatus Scalindua rubra]|uniref:arsenite-transporting ATPase n=1 Tax=Candidatus Scalindua rubra TaxID=1872076 RepID=A0A1E3XF65_9BACT|nr:MAG: oxyanion-translocating ATPase [Candidatus Scalindua rubra]
MASTDPAHSVGDSFNYRVGNTETLIEEVGNLWALEIDADKVGDEFKLENLKVMKKISDRGTYFDKEDIDGFFDLTIPGINEVMGVIRISDIIKQDKYDLVILDTAPTGHTLRLLSLPEEMERWIKLMDMMQSKHRFLMRTFGGRYMADDADSFLKESFNDVRRVRYILSNERLCEFVPVLIPEPMYIEETQRLVESLKSCGIAVNNIIVNRIAKSHGECPFCSSREDDQKEKLDTIEERFSDYNLYRMPLFPGEVCGLDGLREHADILFGRGYQYKRKSFGPVSFPELASKSQVSHILNKDLRVVIFGGKGGVGKTSIAAATALEIAGRHPQEKVLIFSTDPAHSLVDSFDVPIGDKVTPIPGFSNLFAYEIDAEKVMEEKRQGNRRRVQEAFEKMLGRGMDIVFDRDIMTELASINMPGFDEIMALTRITDFMKENRFDVYIVDSAPTGHLLKFLETPQLMRDWLKLIFRILIKYKRVVKLIEFGEEQVELSRNVRAVQKVLTDTEKTEFVAITIPEEMAVVETNRLLGSLKKLKIFCRHIVINMTIPPTNCPFCKEKQKQQRRYIKEIKKEKSSEYEVTEIRLFPHKIAGMKDLSEFSSVIYRN